MNLMCHPVEHFEPHLSFQRDLKMGYDKCQQELREILPLGPLHAQIVRFIALIAAGIKSYFPVNTSQTDLYLNIGS